MPGREKTLQVFARLANLSAISIPDFPNTGWINADDGRDLLLCQKTLPQKIFDNEILFFFDPLLDPLLNPFIDNIGRHSFLRQDGVQKCLEPFRTIYPAIACNIGKFGLHYIIRRISCPNLPEKDPEEYLRVTENIFESQKRKNAVQVQNPAPDLLILDASQVDHRERKVRNASLQEGCRPMPGREKTLQVFARLANLSAISIPDFPNTGWINADDGRDLLLCQKTLPQKIFDNEILFFFDPLLDPLLNPFIDNIGRHSFLRQDGVQKCLEPFRTIYPAIACNIGKFGLHYIIRRISCPNLPEKDPEEYLRVTENIFESQKRKNAVQVQNPAPDLLILDTSQVDHRERKVRNASLQKGWSPKKIRQPFGKIPGSDSMIEKDRQDRVRRLSLPETPEPEPCRIMGHLEISSRIRRALVLDDDLNPALYTVKTRRKGQIHEGSSEGFPHRFGGKEDEGSRIESVGNRRRKKGLENLPERL